MTKMVGGSGHMITYAFILSAATIFRVCLTAGDWTYDDHHGDGPTNWKKKFSNCGRSRQSPIDIRTSVSKYKDMGELQFLGYQSIPTLNSYMLVNNGHTVQLNVLNTNMTISGAELPGSYHLAQFHVHWGSSNSKGSEHTVNGRSYPMEIHFVHFNERDETISKAVTMMDGLAVIGVFVEVGEKSHPGFEKVIQAFCAVKYADEETRNVPVFAMSDLLPTDRKSFYRYMGSLTTPGCQESVVWTVLQQPIKISQTQMNAFRALGHYKKGYQKDAPLEDNFRPIQPLGSRVLLRNHHLDLATTKDSSAGTGHHHPASSVQSLLPNSIFLVALALVLDFFI